MKKILSLSILILFVSCSQKKSNSNDLENPKLRIEQNIDLGKKNTPFVNSNKIFSNNYEGKIGTTLDVLFHLKNDNSKISGFYFYEKAGIDIEFIGKTEGDDFLAYELDFKKDTIAVLKGKISEASIIGKWTNIKSKKEYPLLLKKYNSEISPLPKSIEGEYYNEICNLQLSFFKFKGNYYYKYTSNNRCLKGKVSFSREDDLYIILEGIEYSEDYFDISLPEEEEEKQKEFDRLKENGKRQVGVDCYYSPEEITIQNYGNAMSYYVKLSDCGEKYIHFRKK